MSEEPPRQPEIGTDTWVAQHEQRVQVRWQPLSRFLKWLDRVPITLRVLAVVVLLALLPTIDSSDYIQQVAVNCALLALLALGLNVVVGYSGLDPIGLPKIVLDLLPYFDGGATADTLRRIRHDRGVVLEGALIRRLVDYEILVPPNTATAPLEQ